MKSLVMLLAFGCALVAEAKTDGTDPVVRRAWPLIPAHTNEVFAMTLPSGITVRGSAQRTYLWSGTVLTALSVDVPRADAAGCVRFAAPQKVLCKLVSELPQGWRAVSRGNETEIVIPTDRAHRAYPDEAVLPKPTNVPDLLTAEDGRKITTREDWEKIRRPEILRFFQDHVYGRRPCERPPYLKFEPLAPDRVMMDGAALRKMIRITYGGKWGTNSFPVTVFIPTKAQRPAASFVLICNRDRSKIDPERVVKSPFWPAERLIARGFAAIAFFNGDVSPDYVHGNTIGAFTAFEDVTRMYRPKNMWGQLSCWGWAASRVLDWIETEPRLDATRVAVAGHSRGGKTALVAAAFDTRFAMACVNNSGSCGMKLNHIELPASEHPVHTIRGRPGWYCPNFTDYANRECDMPYDTQCLAALVAPRKLCVASASEDVEAGPLGEFWAAYLASPAWELYGKRGLVAPASYPAVERPLQEGTISYHIRRGHHDLTEYDWDRYMDFFSR